MVAGPLRAFLFPGSLQTSLRSGQEYERRHRADPLVAIQERVVLDQVKEIGGGHLNHIRVQKLAVEGRARYAERRLEQTDYSASFFSALG